MSSHDEHSSDEDDLFEENSSITLGFTDVPLEEEDEEPTIEDTFIGGQPIWLHPNSAPSSQDLKCSNCHKNMALLLQAFAPFSDQPYDRVIYIFACKNSRQCSKKKGTVKAIRGVCKDPSRIAEIEEEQAREARELLDAKLKLDEKKKLHIEMTKDLFDATKPSDNTQNPFSGNPFGGNPFGGNPFDKSSSAGNPFGGGSSSAAEKSIDSKNIGNSQNALSQKSSYADVSRTKKPSKSADGKTADRPALPAYPGYFVFTEPEKFKKITMEPELEKYKDLIDNSDTDGMKKERSLSSSSATSSSALNPENSKIAGMLNDKHFEHFSSTVGHNPSQVLRYSLGGKPLLYSGKDDVAKAFSSATVPDPSYNPSSRRQFELQLMPKAIIDLERDNSDSAADILSGMSWGTITVATDVSDYMPSLDENHVGYVVEYCGVQWEESI